MTTLKEDKLAKLKFEDITMGMNVSQTKVRISLEGQEGCPGIQVDKAWLLRLRDRMTELAGKLVDEEAAPEPKKGWGWVEPVPIGERHPQHEEYPVLVWETFPPPGRWQVAIHAGHFETMTRSQPNIRQTKTHWMPQPPPPKVETQEDKDRKALERYSVEMLDKGVWPKEWMGPGLATNSPAVFQALKILEKAWYAACNYARGGGAK